MIQEDRNMLGYQWIVCESLCFNIYEFVGIIY